MKHSFKIGFSFGLTSGVITTLGLLVGLHSGTHLRSVVIGGILTIAVADAFSDALGIHISEESEVKHTSREIWFSTITTFFSKFIFSSTFIIPVLFLPLTYAVIVSIIWGLLLLTIFSYFLALQQKENPWKVIGEHFLITCIVIFFTHSLGSFLSSKFRG